ncbi:MAG: LPS export ABC transporter periplasmic protein LptC [Desulfovermiculus sp.]|nr:LPS export ABC transporter periplasmic protein LptC [Desulfovermiculus sp.]
MVPVFRQRLTVVVLALVLLAGAAWLIWDHFSDSTPSIQAVYENMDVTVKDLRLVQGGKGKRTWELKARESRYMREESHIGFDRPRITFYKDEGSPPILVRARSGEYFQDEGIAKLWPRVRAEYGQTTVHSQRMVFVQQEQEITFEGDVVIIHPELQATSQTAVIELDNNRLVLTGQVKVDIHGQNTP